MFVESYGSLLFEFVWFGSTWIESEYLWFQIIDFLRRTFSTSKLFLRSAFLTMLLPLRFFTVTFHCDMPCISPVGEILSPDEQWKDVAVVCSVILWDCGHKGSVWVHLSAIINIPPVSGNISTTTQNPEGEVIPITVSHYVCLVEVEGGCLNSRIHPIFCVSPEQVHDTHQVFYRPFYFSSWQWYLSRFSVLVIQFLVIIFPSGVDIIFFSFYYIAKAS